MALSIEERKKRQKVWRDKNYKKTRKQKIQYSIEYTRRKSLDAKRRENLRKKYGITLEQYYEMLAQQNFQCLLCDYKQPEGATAKECLFVDHDHETGKVRGLLCQHCNRGLGSFKDNVEILSKAIQYLNNAKISIDSTNSRPSTNTRS